VSNPKEPSYQQVTDQITSLIRLLDKKYKSSQVTLSGLHYGAGEIREHLIKALKTAVVYDELNKRGF